MNTRRTALTTLLILAGLLLAACGAETETVEVITFFLPKGEPETFKR